MRATPTHTRDKKKPTGQLGLSLAKRGRPARSLPSADWDHPRALIHHELNKSARVFLNDARTEREDGEEERARMYARAAILSGWSSLEAEVNGRLEQLFDNNPKMQFHELGVVREKKLELRNGEFGFYSHWFVNLEEKIKFFLKKCGRRDTLAQATWARFREAQKVRNDIVHAKGESGDKGIATIDNAGEVIATVNLIVDQLRYALEEWLRRNRSRVKG